MSSLAVKWHNEHKQRLAKIDRLAEQNRWNRKAKAEALVAPKPVPPAPEQPSRDEWAGRQIEKHKGYWFSIVSSKVVVQKPSAPSIKDIQRATCKVFGVEIDALLGKRQTRDIARPRQVSMYLAREMTGLSLAAIAKATGGRDHTTAFHAVSVIPGFLKADGKLAHKVERIRRMLA